MLAEADGRGAVRPRRAELPKSFAVFRVGGAEDASETGEEGADYLEAPGGAGGFRTREGIKRGLPAGTLGIAGSDVAKAYQQAMFQKGQPAAMFFTDDVKSDHERIKSHGAQFTMPPLMTILGLAPK